MGGVVGVVGYIVWGSSLVFVTLALAVDITGVGDMPNVGSSDVSYWVGVSLCSLVSDDVTSLVVSVYVVCVVVAIALCFGVDLFRVYESL